MVIRMSYDKHVILPYENGIAVMAALNSVELLEDEYSDTKRKIVEMKRDTITCSRLSRYEYEQLKIANLLGISVADLERHEEEEKSLQETQT